MIIAASIKRKTLETEKIFQEMNSEEAEFFEQGYSDEETETLLVESKTADHIKNKFLVYEEKLVR